MRKGFILQGKQLDTDSLLKLALAGFFIALNGFFVLSEFSLVKVRKTKLEEFVKEKVPNARLALKMTYSIDTYLSATQIGITLASLALGWLGEPAVASLIRPPLEKYTGLGPIAIHTIAVIIAFTMITMFHVVFGEQAPKLVAIARSERMVLFIARPLYVFWMICYPIIKVFDFIAAAAVHLVGVRAVNDSELAHSEEEIKIIADESLKGGVLDSTETEIIQNAVDFGDTVVKEVMTPRKRLVCINKQRSLEENLKLVGETQYTRYPYIDGSKDHVIGMIHIKDILQSVLNGQKPDFDKIARKYIIVPENCSISKIPRMMNKAHISAVLVLDEYGGTAGIATMEDIIEEIVGDISDEYDLDASDYKKLSDTQYEFKGRFELVHIEEMFDMHFEDTDQVTIGGYLFNRFDRLPMIGDKIEDEYFQYEVTKMNAASIGAVRVTLKQRDDIGEVPEQPGA